MHERRFINYNGYDLEVPPTGFNALIDFCPPENLLKPILGPGVTRQFNAFNAIKQLALAMAQRRKYLERINNVYGRAAHAKIGPPLIILGHSYDTLTISGFGYNPLPLKPAQSPSNVVKIPTNDNFAALHPNLTTTYAVHFGEEIVFQPKFAFTGAYTKDEARRKMASNLAILEMVANTNPPLFLYQYLLE